MGQTPTAAIPLILDTDIGNDCDDVLAMGVIHSLQTRGYCRLVAVTITKDHDQCAPFVDAVNTFYGRGEIPIGVCRSGITPQQSRFTGLVSEKDGDRDRYPHDLRSGRDAADAVAVLRRALAAEADGSVVIAQVGFSTNLAKLLQSPGDEISPMTGRELARKKVRMLSVMAGAFTAINGQPHFEYKIQANYQLIGVQLTPHVDLGRQFCFNYLFLTGGDNVRTRWYDDDKQHIVYETTAPLHTWHRIQVDIVHDISEISSQRLGLSVWPAQQ
jgi:hypothetical protein